MIFDTLITVIHVVVCVALILIILLQTGKGADIGAAFGGGSSQTVFGASGAATFLGKITIGAAVIFMMTSIILTYFSGRAITMEKRSIMNEQPAGTQAPTGVPAPGAPPPGSEQTGAAAPPVKGDAAPPANVPVPAPPAAPQQPPAEKPPQSQ